MTQEEKKAFILLKAVILYYHGLDDDERIILDETADAHDAREELAWALQFIRNDYFSAFDRAREFLRRVITDLPTPQKVDYLHEIWKDNNRKGFITEMEATAMLNLARDWNIQREFMSRIRQ